MNKFDNVKNLIMSLEEDFKKFYDKNNQAAGTRVRKGMQELKELAQSIRMEVQNMKNEQTSDKEAPAKKPATAAKKPAAKAAPAKAAPAKAKTTKK
ncbi:MAG: hypothetical protein EAZ57_04150 [Cytophagales bacterium]|nr:MAG: hypothetical protein EAZ67_05170 [Cytophagales bacterium]TAF61192.1 MAG: hypothetical protein EAZ57_04150 [Cytophagales bacterium]